MTATNIVDVNGESIWRSLRYHNEGNWGLASPYKIELSRIAVHRSSATKPQLFRVSPWGGYHEVTNLITPRAYPRIGVTQEKRKYCILISRISSTVARPGA